MLKKTIEYTDYNGVERKEDFYFNLSKAELMEMELSVTGGLVEMVERIVQTQDHPKIISVFKDLILKAYGEKTADGRGFNKSQELRDSFMHTEAYSVLFMELATNDKSASEFINGIVPSDISKGIPSKIPNK